MKISTSKLIRAARGDDLCDLLLKGASYLNVFTERFEKADIAVKDGYIVGIGAGYRAKKELSLDEKFIVPGFIDGHVHLESSLISPSQYARIVAPHGTTALVTDPHEITNVSGEDGLLYMLRETEGLPIDVFFMLPSSVPATPFDEAGAEFTSADIKKHLSNERVLGLAEVMNSVGVLSCDKELICKLDFTKSYSKHIDGHAPSLSGRDLCAYISAGVKTDHECTAIEEAMEKISLGMWVMIREGTACKNLSALLPLFKKPYCDRALLVTDDKHPGELKADGHIDHIIRKAISLGADPVNAYKMASFGAAGCFGLKELGAIAPGYKADLVILDDIDSVSINSVYKSGEAIDSYRPSKKENPYRALVTDSVHIKDIDENSFALGEAPVIGLIPHEIITTDSGRADSVSADEGIAKIAVVERHKATGHIGLAYLRGYGIIKGAVATSVAHDSHNIIAAGISDSDLAVAVNRIAELGGGMVVVNDGEVLAELALPIAGLMCDSGADELEAALYRCKSAAYSLGVGDDIDPFMTLSFASLPVIPKLRITTKGVFDAEIFEYVN